MPIIIKKGSDLIKKKKSKGHGLKKSASQESVEEVVDYSNVARDMTDVLDFKIYHVIKPNFYNDKERVNLIGEAYYQDEEDDSSMQRKGNKSPRSKLLQQEQKPQQKQQLLDSPKASFEEMGYIDMFSRIKANEKNAAVIKIGNSIGKLLDPPTQEESVKWAIRYVMAHADRLTLHVIDLYYQLKSYEGNLESLAKNYKSDRPRAGSDDMHGRDRTVSNFSEDKEHHGRDRKVSNSDAAHPNRPRATSESSGGGGIRRASSRQLSATGSSDPLLGAAGDRLNASQQVSRSKHVSLAQQLEQIKTHGTDAFIRAISPHKDPIFAHGKKHWKVNHHQTSSKASLDSSGAQSSTQAPGGKPWQDMRKASVMLSTVHKMIPGLHGPTDSAASLHHPAPPASARPSSHNTTSGNPRLDGRSPRAQVNPTATATTAPKGPEVLSPTNSPRPAEPISPRDQHKSNKNANTLVNHSQQMLAALLKKTTAIQADIAVRIRKAEKKGARVLKLSREFRTNVESAQMKAACIFEEKEITKSMRISHEVECFDDQNRDDVKSQGLLKDMRKMHEQADRMTQAVQMDRLLQHRWFLALVVKLREFMKKMNNAVPACCLKFVTAVEQIILLGHTLSQEVFYCLIEATVTAKEDHSKAIVHQLLKIARDIVDISAPDFLAYLEDKDINPNPELVNQVRALNRSRKGVTSSAQGSVLTTTLAVPADTPEWRALSPGPGAGPEMEAVIEVVVINEPVSAIVPAEPAVQRSGSAQAPVRPGRTINMASVAEALVLAT